MRARNGVVPSAQNRSSCHQPRPSASTTTICRTPSSSTGSRSASGGGSCGVRAPHASSTVAGMFTRTRPSYEGVTAPRARRRSASARGIGGRYCGAMRTVLEVDGIFDGEKTLSDVAILIENGEIAWVGKRSRAPKTPKGERSRTVEVHAKFATPGMINCHAHLVFDGSRNFEAEAQQSDAEATIKAVKNARSSVRAGVTTVRDLGANGTMVIELGRAIEKGVIDGPRILAAGRGITVTGGHGMEA